MKKFVIPKTGVKVRNPKTGGHIPEEGAIVFCDNYMNRRILDGDLIVAKKPSKKKAVKKKPDNSTKDGDK